MAFENSDFEDVNGEDNGELPPEETGNRAFIIAAGVLGAIALLALLCIAAYAFFILPQRRNQQVQQIATLNAQNTMVAVAITQTSFAAAATWTPTVTPIPPTATPTRTPTAVVVLPTSTSVLSQDPRTATVSALLTQAALTTQTIKDPTATALPKTGFAEDAGLPSMLGLAVVLIVVIFLARRLRTA
jgi:LPXTG-motif cell wall-anchored protein